MNTTSTTISVNPESVQGFSAKLGKILLEALIEVIGPENIDDEVLKMAIPPDPKMGDFSYSCFCLAQRVKRAPTELAKKLGSLLIDEQPSSGNKLIGRIEVAGPYINFFLNRQTTADLIMDSVSEEKGNYGENNQFNGKTIMVEYLAPNTNKPLHIGHLRNGVIGTTVANLLEASGAKVIRANNINDRGIHIIQSMMAYQLWGNEESPSSTGEKGDHFVGRYYVRFHQEIAKLFKQWLDGKNISIEGADSREKDKIKEEFQKQCPLVQRSHEMLSQWEAGDPAINALWKKMNQWVYEGFDLTNRRVGFTFDRVYYESNTYKLGREIILNQLGGGVGGYAKDGSTVIDLTDVGMGSNPISLIRKDGTSLYITQDIGLAATRFTEIAGLGNIIYVVAKEQEFHFKALFEILRRYGYPWHSQLYHLSYGMVNLPSGRMKSREGTIVDADELTDQLHSILAEIIKGNDTNASLAEVNQRAEAVAIGALKYMLVSVSPKRDILFDPQKSVSLDGKTGPYIQYACVRISAIKEKASAATSNSVQGEISDEEFEVIKMLGLYPAIVKRSAVTYDPSLLADGLYDIARSFSGFYAKCPVVHDGVANKFRYNLCEATDQVLKNGLKLLGISVPNKM